MVFFSMKMQRGFTGFFLLTCLMVLSCSPDRMVLEECGEPGEKAYAPPEHGILNQQWKKGKLHVEGFIKTYCEGVRIESGHHVSGQQLEIYYRVNLPSLSRVSKCKCIRRFHYVADDLPEGKYRVSITKRE
jgi:hypothetical protein